MSQADDQTKPPHPPAEEPVQIQWASGGGKLENPTAQCLRANAEHSYQFARIGTSLRRFTPREWERLQGFPDDYTDVTFQGKQPPDSLRYKSLGNSMAVNCMAWIGERIAAREWIGDKFDQTAQDNED